MRQVIECIAIEGKKKERNWVACDKCSKWRKLPKHVEPACLPDVWECKMMSDILSSSRLSCETGQDPEAPVEEEEEVPMEE